MLKSLPYKECDGEYVEEEDSCPGKQAEAPQDRHALESGVKVSADYGLENRDQLTGEVECQWGGREGKLPRE